MLIVVISAYDKITNVALEEMFNSLTKKINGSGIWASEILPDPSLAKKFKRDFDQFVQTNDF